MIRRPIHRSTALLLGVVSLVLLLGGYTWLAAAQHKQNPTDTTMPTWNQLVRGVGAAIEINPRDGTRWLVEDAKASGFRLFMGLALGVAGALVLGMLMGCFPPIESMCYPPLSLLAKIPATAALAVFFVIAGTGESMYVSMITFGVLPTLAISVSLAVKDFPEELQFKAYTLGASHAEVVCTIIFRYVLPKLLDAIRLVIGPAMIALIGAELYVGEPGFGYRIRLQSKLLNMSVVYPYLALLAGFGFAMDYLLRMVKRKCCPWHESFGG